MELGKKIIKVIIVILEGCVVKLKEVEERFHDKKDERTISTSKINDNKDEKTMPQYDSNECYLNMSLLDDFIKSINLPIGSTFMKILSGIELNTEKNLLEILSKSISSKESVRIIISSFSNPDYLNFRYFSPSSLRIDETSRVSKEIIERELTKIGLLYSKESIYSNCLHLFEGIQRNVIKGILDRFSEPIDCLLKSEAEDEKRKIDVLKKEINDRQSILEIKLSRVS